MFRRGCAWLERVQNEAIIVQIKIEDGIGREYAFEDMLQHELTKMRDSRPWECSSWHRYYGQLTNSSFRLSSMEGWSCRIATSVIDVVPTFAELIHLESPAVDTLI